MMNHIAMPINGPHTDKVGDRMQSTQIDITIPIQWLRAFSPLLVIVVLGMTVFAGPVASSISSTPHPSLVYSIFGGALAASVLFGFALQAFLAEQVWFKRFSRSDQSEQEKMLSLRTQDAGLGGLYLLVSRTKGLPLALRRPALERELDSAEHDMFATLALPNLLSGSLVGLGLVGTFIGLLGTLSELSSVFAALGGGAGGGQDAGAMFSTMIRKLQGPMQGMGTAFVASLYGLLGSLVIGLVGSAVRGAGERLFTSVRSFVTEDLYARAGNETAERTDDLTLQVLQDGQERLRQMLEHWTRESAAQFSGVAAAIENQNEKLGEMVDVMRAQMAAVDHRQVELEKSEKRVLKRLERSRLEFMDRVEVLLAGLKGMQTKGSMGAGRWTVALALGIGLACLSTMAAFELLDRRSRATNLPIRVDAERPRLQKPAPVEPRTDLAVPSNRRVVVQVGDSLGSIAQREKVRLDELIAANPQVQSPHHILPGMTIEVP